VGREVQVDSTRGNGSRVVSRGRVGRESAGVGGEVVPLDLLSSSEKRSENVIVKLSGSSSSRELEVCEKEGRKRSQRRVSKKLRKRG